MVSLPTPPLPPPASLLEVRQRLARMDAREARECLISAMRQAVAVWEQAVRELRSDAGDQLLPIGSELAIATTGRSEDKWDAAWVDALGADFAVRDLMQSYREKLKGHLNGDRPRVKRAIHEAALARAANEALRYLSSSIRRIWQEDYNWPSGSERDQLLSDIGWGLHLVASATLRVPPPLLGDQAPEWIRPWWYQCAAQKGQSTMRTTGGWVPDLDSIERGSCPGALEWPGSPGQALYLMAEPVAILQGATLAVQLALPVFEDSLRVIHRRIGGRKSAAPLVTAATALARRMIETAPTIPHDILHDLRGLVHGAQVVARTLRMDSVPPDVQAAATVIDQTAEAWEAIGRARGTWKQIWRPATEAVERLSLAVGLHALPLGGIVPDAPQGYIVRGQPAADDARTVRSRFLLDWWWLLQCLVVKPGNAVASS